VLGIILGICVTGPLYLESFRVNRLNNLAIERTLVIADSFAPELSEALRKGGMREYFVNEVNGLKKDLAQAGSSGKIGFADASTFLPQGDFDDKNFDFQKFDPKRDVDWTKALISARGYAELRESDLS
jgi:hypothetical protein